MVFFQLNVTGLLFQSFRTASPLKEQKCRYVHDVQHYLMDEFGEDDLKIHHIL